jgi:DNA-binding protein YbaB
MSEIEDALRELTAKAKAGDGDDLQATVGRLRDQMESWTEGLAAVQSGRYEGKAADDQVVAEVDGHGGVARLEIGPYAMRDLDAGGLAEACTEAIGAARTALSEALMAHVSTVRGGAAAAIPPERTDPREIWRKAKEAAGWNV